MTVERAKGMRLRIAAVGLAFVVALAAILAKAWILQVEERDGLVEKARQEIETRIRLGAVRGEIFDAN
ncbi:MAG: hypothetical protein LBS31_01745, partial [Candidatus Adiutrix sp.]|nr:hypothetical protein [Candidatus Adiutrix sp.]